jgi:hypothetical protein
MVIASPSMLSEQAIVRLWRRFVLDYPGGGDCRVNVSFKTLEKVGYSSSSDMQFFTAFCM